MNNIFSKVTTPFFVSLKYLKNDKVLWVLYIVPIIIGLALYGLFGHWVYQGPMEWMQNYVDAKMESQAVAKFLFYFLSLILWVLVFIAINLSFVIVVSIIASPFNDLITSRIYQKENPHIKTDFEESKKSLLPRLIKVIINEIKKAVFLILISIVASLLSLVGFLAPLGYALTSYVISLNFVGYSWSMQDKNFKTCKSDAFSNFLPYCLSGMIFLFLLGIPLLNLFMLPFAVSYYGVMNYRLNEQSMTSKH